MTLQISHDGVTWVALAAKSRPGETGIVNDNTWRTFVQDVSLAGLPSSTDVQFRFTFDSVDDVLNENFGFSVDNIMVVVRTAVHTVAFDSFTLAGVDLADVEFSAIPDYSGDTAPDVAIIESNRIAIHSYGASSSCN